ncbi:MULTISPECIES: Firmicu-CTERM sorting domain-containing protein [Clostridium]|uniref:Firmicu-CTERM sorting domain-containing protein n=1 Tax=Clostridium TaxID=1485 RepID=UPI000826187D|nr:MULTISPECIES: Firmicu-CTERM sorting domain-containing protein [Clostridium]PJI09516.1 Firmicu-CTERM sorting domain-containing protein [Clostridium sp. CT7]
MKKLLKDCFFVCIIICIMFPMNTLAAQNGVTLDGYFDDWNGKPVTYLRYTSVATEQVHSVRQCTDSSNLYLNIKMGTKGGQRLDRYVIECSMSNGQMKHFQIAPDEPKVGRVTIYDMDGGYRAVSQDGYVVRGNNNDGKTSDQAEFRIPLSEFQSGNSMGISNVTLKIPDLGDRCVVFQTGSTGPYVGVILCGIVAAAGAFLSLHRRIKAQA